MAETNGASSTPSFPTEGERFVAAPEPQSCGRVLMVRPATFGYNEETAPSNAFQNKHADEPREIRRRAWHEFDAAVERLLSEGIEVHVWDDRPEPAKPDAIFPNNWLSTHGDGTLVLYPLEARVRRAERDPELVSWLSGRFKFRRLLDLSALEKEGQYLEGTGSLVLDRPGRVAYCALSSRSDPRALERWSREMGYRTLTFRTDDGHGRPVYHTNVVLAIGSRIAVVVEQALRERHERNTLRENLESSGRRVHTLDLEAMCAFGANALELSTRVGPVWVLSTRAWRRLPSPVRRDLEKDVRVLPLDVTTVEDVGGGGIRCMLAEIFLAEPPTHKVGETRRSR